jgi:hypothetical protein
MRVPRNMKKGPRVQGSSERLGIKTLEPLNPRTLKSYLRKRL